MIREDLGKLIDRIHQTDPLLYNDFKDKLIDEMDFYIQQEVKIKTDIVHLGFRVLSGMLANPEYTKNLNSGGIVIAAETFTKNMFSRLLKLE